MVPCARVIGCAPPVRMRPKPVPRSDGSTPSMICAMRVVWCVMGGKGSVVERAFLPLKRCCICSNCCREMPTGRGCQRRRDGKRKNAATLPSRREQEEQFNDFAYLYRNTGWHSDSDFAAGLARKAARMRWRCAELKPLAVIAVVKGAAASCSPVVWLARNYEAALPLAEFGCADCFPVGALASRWIGMAGNCN